MAGQDDTRELAEQLIGEIQAEAGDEEQARELLDVPSQSAGDLAEEQRAEE